MQDNFGFDDIDAILSEFTDFTGIEEKKEPLPRKATEILPDATMEFRRDMPLEKAAKEHNEDEYDDREFEDGIDDSEFEPEESYDDDDYFNQQ